MTESQPWYRSLTTFRATLFLAIIAVLPFERIPSVVVGGFTVKISYVLGLVLLVLALFELLRRKVKLTLTQSDYLLILFWAAAFVSNFFSPDLKRSTIIWLVWGFVFAQYRLAVYFFSNPVLRRRAEQILLIVTVLICVFGIYQFVADSLGAPLVWSGLRQEYSRVVFGFPRIQSVALEPLYFSDYLLVPLFLVLWRYATSKERFGKYFWVASLLFINIILGISRGAYIALGCSLILLLVFLVYRRQQYSNELRRIGGMIGALVLAMIISAGMVSLLDGSHASQNFVSHAGVSDTQTGTSVPGRLETYRLAFQFFKEKPILGNGVASFGLKTVQSPAELKQFGYGIVNNQYLETLMETGLVGTLILLGFLVSVGKSIRDRYLVATPAQRLYQVFLLLGMLAIFIQYNFFSTLYILYIWVFLAYTQTALPSAKV